MLDIQLLRSQPAEVAARLARLAELEVEHDAALARWMELEDA